MLRTNASPLLSVFVLTYNHINFIRECLDGILMQKTNFPLEIIIHDDASTDGTQEIIKEYEQKHPDLIKAIYQKENQYSKKGIGHIFNSNFELVRGKYLALCESDDYFTDENKLQIQVDFMESNKDCSVSFHPVKVVWENSEHPNSIFPTPEWRFNKTTLKLNDLLQQNFIQTNSVIYRWAFYAKKYEPFLLADFLPIDWYFHLYHAQLGKICFIDKCMSVYRKHENGIWNGGVEKIWLKYWDKHLAFFEEVYKNIAIDKKKYLKTINPLIWGAYNIFIDNYFKQGIDFMENHPLWSKLVSSKQKNTKQCYICRKTFSDFNKYNGGTATQSSFWKELDIVGSDVDNFGCPYCHCHDRERHFFAYFDKLNLWLKENSKILHFAPENHLYKKINSLKPLEYIKADWEPELYENRGIKDVKKINLMEITFDDNYFDIVICNHILEHVPNLQKCLSEIHRVLKKDGFAILQTPFSKLLHNHFEDSGIITSEQKNFFYGQSDHVRVVSEKQFFKDLESAGFKLDIIKHKDLFDYNFAKIYGINPKEDLIKVIKI